MYVNKTLREDRTAAERKMSLTGIDIGLINKYYDITRIGDEMARSHYGKLAVHADACMQCGHCEKRCPFRVKQMIRMLEIKNYFGK